MSRLSTLLRSTLCSHSGKLPSGSPLMQCVCAMLTFDRLSNMCAGLSRCRLLTQFHAHMGSCQPKPILTACSQTSLDCRAASFRRASSQAISVRARIYEFTDFTTSKFCWAEGRRWLFWYNPSDIDCALIEHICAECICVCLPLLPESLESRIFASFS